MYTTLKFAHFIGLSLLVGAPIFWFLIWRPASRNTSVEDDPSTVVYWSRVRRGVLWGAGIFAISGLADALRAAAQVISLSDFEMLGTYFSQIRYGQMSLLKAALAPVFAAVILSHRPKDASVVNFASLHPIRAALLVLVGGAMILSISSTSHAAGRAGAAPLIVDAIHQVAAVLWGGAILYFAALPWSRLYTLGGDSLPVFSRALNRFSGMALVAVLVVSVTGFITSYFHVYDTAALSNTPYGKTLLLKVALVAIILGAAAVNLFVIGPRMKKLALKQDRDDSIPDQPLSKRDRLTRFLRLLRGTVQIEAILILGVLAAAANLTTLPPADSPAFVADGAWVGETGPYTVRLEMASTDTTTGQVEVGVYISDQGAPPPPQTRVNLHLVMLDHDMGTNVLEARPISDGYYATDGLISMAGLWEARILITPTDGESLELVLPFEAASGALDQGRLRRLDFSAAWVSPEQRISFLLGVLLVFLALVGILGAQRGRMASWAAPFGLCVALLGSLQLLGLTLVDAYPTTYVRNPVPYTAERVTQGRALYVDNCAVCHGETGRGDGPAAVALNPQPADLAASHVDDHTDGDIFWWLTHGIPGTAMPGWEEQLTEEERWALVQYVRSVRHGVPIPGSLGGEL